VEHFLVPALSRGNIVDMDNLSSHKVSGIRQAIELTGSRLWYLPPCSPDRNPIEQAWSKAKSVLRSSAPKHSATSSEPMAQHSWGISLDSKRRCENRATKPHVGVGESLFDWFLPIAELQSKMIFRTVKRRYVPEWRLDKVRIGGVSCASNELPSTKFLGRK
jgi:transposase